MALIATCAVGLFLFVLILGMLQTKRVRERRRVEEHSIEPEALSALLAANNEILLLDVRQPLDLLAYPEIIPGAKRIPPKDLLEQPSLVCRECDAVIYCTCPSEKTSRTVLRKVLALNFSKIKFLKGGLAGWKAKGFPVEPYKEPFHLDTAG